MTRYNDTLTSNRSRSCKEKQLLRHTVPEYLKVESMNIRIQDRSRSCKVKQPPVPKGPPVPQDAAQQYFGGSQQFCVRAARLHFDNTTSSPSAAAAAAAAAAATAAAPTPTPTVRLREMETG